MLYFLDSRSAIPSARYPSMPLAAAASVRYWTTAFLTLRDETLNTPAPESFHILLQNLIFSLSEALVAAAPAPLLTSWIGKHIMATVASARSWRTSFLTLRDETLSTPAATSLHILLQNLIFSQSEALVAAAPALPPHEVAADVIFLVELADTSSQGRKDVIDSFVCASRFILDISRRVSLEINSTSWAIMLDFLGKAVELFLAKADPKNFFLENAARINAMVTTLEILRYLSNGYGRDCSPVETTQLVKVLLHIVACSHAELVSSCHSSGNLQYAADIGIKSPKCKNIPEIQAISFAMIGDAFSRVGSAVPIDMWESTLQVMRKVMDVLASKCLLVEDHFMSRFYASLLNCLHVVLSYPKGSLSEHVPGFVAALRLFFSYGLANRPSMVCLDAGSGEKEVSSISMKSNFSECRKIEHGPYRPPHLRKKMGVSRQQPKTWDSQSFSENEPSAVGFTSSDSEHSDSDGSVRDMFYFRCSKARIAAITCIQDLCQADPKSFCAHWTMLLPTSDVLQSRKYEATLMTCLLFDPVLKTRIASAATLVSMLDGPSSTFLQVAEYKESSKYGSFTALSSSLGQIIMQLHTGILYLIQHETHPGLLASSFKILMLLVSSTPYARMPGELLPSIILSLQTRVTGSFPLKSDQTGLLTLVLNCLGATLSTSPPSLHVKELLQQEILTGLVEAQGKSYVICNLFQLAEQTTNPVISIEALKVLRVLSHNYPNIIAECWENLSVVVHRLIKIASTELPSSEAPIIQFKGDAGDSVGSVKEKFITAAVRVLDECLRATSGFRGTEDLLDDRVLGAPFTSDFMRAKRISSAPSYGLDNPEVPKDHLKANPLGGKQWCEAIEKHLPLILSNVSPMVRAASITCFAGITSSVFISLSKEKQDFILSSSIITALDDDTPSVRSAACRAIGVIVCFPQIAQSAGILDKFIHAVKINTQDTLISVRITASWALANICDALRYRASDLNKEKSSADHRVDCQLITPLAECALRLTNDNDKVKSNAVRALGNLSRFIEFSTPSVHDELVSHPSSCKTTDNIEVLPSNNDSKAISGLQSLRNVFEQTSLIYYNLLERIVEAFLSCVTTGNVKVQWNVCHAMSNLFLNQTLKLQGMSWAPSIYSILLLLLRDSSNFKIRIHAAAALAVPATRLDYGRSFSDIVQGLVHIIESLGSEHILTPSSFKYRVALENQLTSTTLHVLSLISCTDHEPLKDFLVKKAYFLEEWFHSVCSLVEARSQHEEASSAEKEDDGSLTYTQKKEMISQAITSLVEVFVNSNHPGIARRFEKLTKFIL